MLKQWKKTAQSNFETGFFARRGHIFHLGEFNVTSLVSGSILAVVLLLTNE